MRFFKKLHLFIEGFREGWVEETMRQNMFLSTETKPADSIYVEPSSTELAEEIEPIIDKEVEPVISVYDSRIFFEPFSTEVNFSPFYEESHFEHD
jgi:hypothetical protein